MAKDDILLSCFEGFERMKMVGLSDEEEENEDQASKLWTSVEAAEQLKLLQLKHQHWVQMQHVNRIRDYKNFIQNLNQLRKEELKTKTMALEEDLAFEPYPDQDEIEVCLKKKQEQIRQHFQQKLTQLGLIQQSHNLAKQKQQAALDRLKVVLDLAKSQLDAFEAIHGLELPENKLLEAGVDIMLVQSIIDSSHPQVEPAVIESYAQTLDSFSTWLARINDAAREAVSAVPTNPISPPPASVAREVLKADKGLEPVPPVSPPPVQTSTPSTAANVNFTTVSGTPRPGSSTPFASPTKIQDVAPEVQQPSRMNDVISDHVFESDCQRCDALVLFKNKWVEECQFLVKSEELKPFRALCQKAVSTTVNALCTSASFIQEKAKKLTSLFRGEAVDVNGMEFSASAHPLGIPFCKYMCAKKFVDQAEEVGEKPKTAFYLASAILALWVEFHDFGQLLLAFIVEVCPGFIPCATAQRPDESTVLFLLRQGYKQHQGSLENRHSFLNRISGIARVYAAITVSYIPAVHLNANTDHPHGLGNMWKLLSSTMNLPPVNDITVTVLFHVLEVCAHEMIRRYQRQFIKLIHLLKTDYLDKIKAVTQEDCLGPVDRLEMWLDKFISAGSVNPPKGIIAMGFI